MTMVFSSLLSTLIFSVLSLANPLSDPSWLGHPSSKEIVLPPHNWIKLGPAPSNHQIILRIGLSQSNFGALEQRLLEVSDPSHVSYGKHLSKEEVDAFVAPHPQSIAVVDQWLSSHGLKPSDCMRSPSKDWVTVTVPVKLAETMLDTTYHIWKHADSGESIVRTTSYSLPLNLHSHVEVVQPTTMFAQLRPMKSTVHKVKNLKANSLISPISSAENSTAAAVCALYVTLKCLQLAYDFAEYVPQVPASNSIGITGYLEEYANIEDLQSFYREQHTAALANSSFAFVSVNGGINNQTLQAAGTEANLDAQFAFGLTWPTPGTFWSTAGRPPFIPDAQTPNNTNEPYGEWLDFIIAQTDGIPRTISTSYGDFEQTVPEAYARRLCAGFAQLGARGISLLFASGDNGVGGNPTECLTNDGRNTTAFLPAFPASCPFVTSVGATTHVPEVAASFSGGGFSNYFRRPMYQDTVVNTYLENLPDGIYKGLYNQSGRAYPDVSALGTNYTVWVSGKRTLVDGTSASAPAFAAVIALLNDARLANNLPPLGFLNPLLYSKGISGLHDITTGKNPGCGTPGFNATVGWDPVTGLGTPNFTKLKELVLQDHGSKGGNTSI